MFKAVLHAVVLWCLASGVMGCDSGANPNGGGAAARDRQAEQMARQAEREVEDPARPQTQEDVSASAPVSGSTEPSAVTTDDMKQGSTLRDQGSYLSAVGAARFSAEHRIILNKVTHAMNLYNAQHGRYPKSHEEFMTDIIEANDIQLPELEPGHEYMYDPEDHELKKRPMDELPEDADNGTDVQ